MIDADGQVALLASIHNEFLDRSAGNLEGIGELSKIENKLDLDRVVDLGQLLEEPSENNLLKRADVFLHFLVCTNFSQDWGDLLADGERVEVDLENFVQIANLGAG